jgi:topoisomerase IV subunit A
VIQSASNAAGVSDADSVANAEEQPDSE